jgi:hypothetical protein
MTDQELDVEALRTELDQIKDAMGIRERSEHALEFWLYVAALVVVAATISQYVHLQRLPGWFHTVVWGGIFGGFFAVLTWGPFDRTPRFRGDESKPSLFVLFLTVWLAAIPIQVVFGNSNVYQGYVTTSARILGLALILLGVGYVVAGNVLKAYYIRRRDRLAFYLGGFWMVVLGAAMPHVDLFRSWGYAVFGGVYAVYAVAVYLLLRGGDDD